MKLKADLQANLGRPGTRWFSEFCLDFNNLSGPTKTENELAFIQVGEVLFAENNTLFFKLKKREE